MKKSTVALVIGVALALAAIGGGYVASSVHDHTVTITKVGELYYGQKQPYGDTIKVDRYSGGIVELVNQTDDTIEVRLEETESSCHMDFVPIGVACSSGKVTVAPQTTSAGLEVYARLFAASGVYAGVLSVNKVGSPAQPIDPEIEIEGDNGLFTLIAAVLSVLALLAGVILRGRQR